MIPAKFRTKLGENFILTKGLNGCLWIFSERAWSSIQKRLTPRSFLDQKGIMLERFFLGSAVESTTDRQGRMPIPGHLMEYAGIKPESGTWILGLSNKIEIWSKERWQELNEKLSDEYLAQLGEDLEGPPNSDE